MSKRPTSYEGKAMELLACDYLRSAGLVIVEQNYRVGHYEIDIVAMEGDLLVFVEVKARQHEVSMETVEELIDSKKSQRIVTAADHYCQQASLSYTSCRFDYLFVTHRPGAPAEVVHIPNAFYPSL